jgi:hypothetical protein
MSSKNKKGANKKGTPTEAETPQTAVFGGRRSNHASANDEWTQVGEIPSSGKVIPAKEKN